MTKNGTLTDHLKRSLNGMAFSDIKRCAGFEKGDAKMGGFILCSCFIDTMASLYYGKDSNGDLYEKFIKEFLPKYSNLNLYKNLRCKLVHNYTEGGVIFTDAKPRFHLKTNEDGRLIVNLENFLQDIEQAYEAFINDVDSNQEVSERVSNRIEKVGLLSTEIPLKT